MSNKYNTNFNAVEGVFRRHHGNTLKEEVGSVRIMLEKLDRVKRHVPLEVLQFYIRCRIYFRVKLLNKKLLDQSRKKLLKLSKNIK